MNLIYSIFGLRTSMPRLPSEGIPEVKVWEHGKFACYKGVFDNDRYRTRTGHTVTYNNVAFMCVVGLPTVENMLHKIRNDRHTNANVSQAIRLSNAMAQINSGPKLYGEKIRILSDHKIYS